MSKHTPEKSKFMEFRLPKFSFKDNPTNIFLIIVVIIFAFLLGMLTNKILYLENAAKTASLQAQQPNPAQQVEPTEDLSPKQVSVDNDPVLGEKNAKVTLIEFSDFQCPFCKRYFDDTYEQVKKEYVDTGKVKMVYRDLPLSFHANAHKAAQASECANEQNSFWEYHDFLFANQDDWASLTGDAVDATFTKYASQVGGSLDQVQFQSCLTSEKYKSEVDKDLADAGAVGANGTPTFLIGKSSSSGTISGTKLVGAQPFSEFKRVIDLELEK